MVPRALIVVLLLTTLGAARPAAALDEEEWQLGLAPTFAVAIGDRGGLAPGGGGRLEGRYALTDSASIGAGLGASWYHAGYQTVRVATASAGLTMAWNVVRWVPFAAIHGAVANVHVPGAVVPGAEAGREESWNVGFEVIGGAEYLIDRSWSIAALGRVQLLPVALEGPSLEAVLVDAGLRLARTF